jgi:hypothetical protein
MYKLNYVSFVHTTVYLENPKGVNFVPFSVHCIIVACQQLDVIICMYIVVVIVLKPSSSWTVEKCTFTIEV